MALSLLSQHPSPNFLDLQTLFDPFLQRGTTTTTTTTTKTYISIYNDIDQMEYDNSNQNQHHYQHNHNSNSNGNSNSGISSNNSSSNNNNNNNNNSNTKNHNNSNQSNFQSGNITENLNNTNQTFMSGYHHQHIGTDYEQVINFVDSPPNSEESWTDEHSKGSPRPQIIDVQTIYSNGGSRKRRMDWDSLDIGQSGNTASAHCEEVANKIPHTEKDKQKKEKLAGRGSWTDDIGFDLNAEFNSNSYLNNEPFLSFSPALTVLKQEPQTDQLNANNNSNSNNKSPLNSHSCNVDVPKIDRSQLGNSSHKVVQEKLKNDLNNTVCGCSSPQSTQPGFDQNTAGEQNSKSATGQGNAGPYNVEKSVNGGAAIQQLTVVDVSSIDNSPSNNSTSHSEDHKFQYILGAATSIATKNNEETLTYLNQGQSYEIKLKKIGDLSFYRDKILKSVIKICFHERRLQFMEREQMQQWQASRPGERIIEVDVPLSYGLCHVSQPLNPNYLNTVEVFWDPLKEVGVYVKVNCISTEFTPKKHGGEKGVPFRLQIETYIENTNNSSAASSAPTVPPSQSPLGAAASPGTPGNLTPTNNSSGGGSGGASLLVGSGKQPVHAAACQIKVFKLKGADRKHKQDREKIQRRPASEQEKFQPSYECTIMNDIPLDLITSAAGGCYSPEYMKIWPNSPVHIPKYDGILQYASASPAANTSPIAINNVTSTNSPTLKLMDANIVSPQQVATDMDDYVMNIMPDSSTAQVTQWLTHHRLTAYLSTFAHFSGSDIMRMSKEDLIQICGLADGIRMFNILRAKAITPRLTLYVSLDGNSYNAIYLISNTSKELTQKLFKLPGFYDFIANNGSSNGGVGSLENGAHYNNWSGMHSKYSGSGSNIFNDGVKSLIYLSGPAGVHVTVTDDVMNNEIKDGSLYALEVQNGKVVMKMIIKNDN